MCELVSKKTVKKMPDSGIRTRHFWLPYRVDTPHICCKQDTNYSTDDSARHVQNQEKEKNFRPLNGTFSFRISL